MNAWIHKRCPRSWVGELLRERKHARIDFDVVEPFGRVPKRLYQAPAESAAYEQDPARIWVQQERQVNAFFGGDFVFAGEEQHAVVKKRALFAPRNHGQKAVARGLKGNDLLAGKTCRREGRGNPRASKRCESDDSQACDCGYRSSTPGQGEARCHADRSCEEDNPRALQSVSEEKMKQQPGGGRADGFSTVDGRGLSPIGKRRHCPCEAKPPDETRRDKRDQRRQHQRENSGHLSNRLRTCQAGQP